ncbi:MAG: flagellar hook-length control protein [Fibrobacteres bacterium]|nr:flagellar hook-length control protein [Fibrobacterota bacterium]
MPEVQNLLDMFLNNRKDVQAKGAKPLESKSQPQGVKASRDLLPIETLGKAAVAPKSFQAKIKESHAKLAAKNEAPSPHNRTPDIKPRNDAPKDNGDSRSQADRASRADQTRSQSRRDDQGQDDGVDSAKPDWKAGRSQSDMNGAQKPSDNGQAENDSADMDAAAEKELKDGLARMGIKASDEQLQDPAFLSDVLQMLQALPAQTIPGSPDTEAANPEGSQADIVPAAADPAQATASAPTLPEENAQSAGEAPAETAADSKGEKPQVATVAGKPADSKEMAALIQDRIEALAGKDAADTKQAGTASITGSAPTTTPAGWQGIKVRPQTESVTTQPLPMADLDRMRVLQAAALQAGNTGKEAEAAPASGMAENDSVDATRDIGNSMSVSDRKNDSADAGNEGLSDGETGLFGRNGDAAKSAEAAARKDGPMASKDGAAGPVFQTNLEQARSVDSRSGVQRAWEPRPAFEPSALEQIAKKMSAQGHKVGDEINIQLSPEHLGKVRVSLEMKEGAMSARIAVESDSVKQQVEAGIATLRDALENQGIKLQGLEVTVDQRHGSLFNPDGSNAESFFHRNGKGGQGGSQGTAEIAPFESAPESDTGRRLGYNTMEYIG